MKFGNVASLQLLSPAEPTPAAQITLVDATDDPDDIDKSADIEDEDEAAEIAAMVQAGKAQDLGQLQRDARAGKSAVDVSMLTLAPANLRRAQEIRRSFAQGGEDDAGAELLEDLVAGEVAVCLELTDIEAAMASLLGKAIGNPTVALAVAKTLSEVASVNNTIRRRMENGLAAARTLRAQRLLLQQHRGMRGG